MREKYSPEQLATPAQAQELLWWLNEYALSADEMITSFELDSLPPSLMQHVPLPDAALQQVSYQLIAKRENSLGVEERLGTLIFGQMEHLTDDLVYGTHLEYQLRVAEGSDELEIERHIKSQEYDITRVFERAERYMSDAANTAEEIYDEVMTSEVYRTNEKDLGLLDVTFEEARQILRTCQALTA